MTVIELKQLLEKEQQERQGALATKEKAKTLARRGLALIDNEDGSDEDRVKAKNLSNQAEDMYEIANRIVTNTDVAIARLQQQISNANKAILPGSMPEEVQPPQPASDEKHAMQKNIYQMRFGNEEKRTKAILVDLHGPNYMQQWADQKAGFLHYLRTGKGIESPLSKAVILSAPYVGDLVASGRNIAAYKATMVSGIDTLGGYAIPVDDQAEILKRLPGLTVMRGRARETQTTRDTVRFIKMTGGDTQYSTNVRVKWVSETPVAGEVDTNITLGRQEISVNKMMASTYISRDTVEDEGANLIGELIQAFGESRMIEEDNKFITGDGAGKPEGILIGGTVLKTGVTSVISANATLLTPTGLIDLVYSLPVQYRRNAIFIMNSTTVGAIRNFVGGDGQFLWTRGSMADGEPDKLLGFAIAEQEVMPDVAAGAYPILFGDPQGYRIVDRIGMTIERFLDSATSDTDTIKYNMRYRVGGQCTHPERWRAQEVSA